MRTSAKIPAIGHPLRIWKALVTVALLPLCVLWVPGVVRASETPAAHDRPASYAGRSLTEVLLELQASDLRIVFSSNVVRPDMRVVSEPTATAPRDILTELLAPHGLEVQDGPGGTLVVVRGRIAPVRAESSLRGEIRSRSSSRPLSGATVRVVGSDVAVSTSVEGSFLITDLEAGRVSLEATKVGFLPARLDDVVVTAGQSTEVTISLEPLPVLVDELVVTPSRISLLREEPTAPFALGREEILGLPHVGNDFFRALSLLPGTTANDISAQFHVRGARRDETQILLDGQELYESFHLKDFDNALSVVMPGTIGSVELTTGGFSVQYGDRMSGVLDMTTIKPSGRPRGRLGAGIWSAHAGASGSLQAGRGSWILELRRGSTDFAGKVIGEEAPSYWDAFGKLDYQLDAKNSVRLNLLQTDDEFELEEVRDDESKRIETDYDSSYLWLTHQLLISSDLMAESAASISVIDRDRNGLELEEDAQFLVRDQRELEVLALRQDWSHRLTARHFLRWGFQLRRFATLYDYTGSRSFDNPLAAIRGNFDSDTTVFRETFTEEHHSAHVADRWRPRERLTLELGLRFDLHSQTSERLVSPRFNLAYALGERSVLRFAWGRFTQSQRPYELQVEDGETRFHPVERSAHWIVGFEHLFETVKRIPGLAVRVEAYRREVSNPRPRYENLFEPFNNFPEAEPDRVRVAPDRSAAHGLEIFLRGRLGQRTGWWVNYAYASTEDRIASAWVHRSFDQTHTLNLDLDQHLGKHWKLNLAWRYHTGWPTTPISLTAIEGEEGATEFVPVLGPLNSRRLSDYHRLDLRASRSWKLGRVLLTGFADIQNVYNRKNLAGFDFDIDDEEGTISATEEEWVGFLPSLGIGIEF